jgi:lipopolysaccharide/colanic/teichoic acid biosynthesis glycosyltransferase
MTKKKRIYEQWGKRLLDIVLSFVGIIVLSPILLLLSIAIKFKLGSPILFVQERPGLNGKVFIMYKFRSMTDERDLNGNLLSDDIRLTKFGKALRATSLDELPELFNILKGDMSIVGPRPLLVEYLPLYNEHQKRRHEVLPGLTGLAQVNGRNVITWEEKFNFDIKYVDNITLTNDIRIIIATFHKVFVRHGINTKSNEIMPIFTGNDDISKRKEKAEFYSSPTNSER